MPVPTANVSGDINAAIGEVSTLRVTAVYSDPVWADETNNAVIVGGGVIPVTSDGLIDVTLPQTNDTVRVAINVEYVDNATRQRKSASSGWQELTADVDFATFMATTPTSVPLSTAEALAARIDGYTDHGDVSGVLTIDPATGTHVLNATGSLLVTLDTAPDGRIVTLYIVGGAESVTVDGMTDLELTDGAFASFVRIRGAWVLASAGAAGEPATPDTTPPSAVTDLAVTPGSDGVTATATFSPATDAESTVKYRYRLYATGTTAPAWPTSGAQYNLTGSPINLTGLTAGEDYTMDLQAYSAGGSAAADTATFTTPTPAGWNVWDSIDFADQTAGTFASPKDFTTDQGRTLRATTGADPSAIIVGSNKVKGVFQQSPVNLVLNGATPPNESRVTIPYELVGSNPSYPSLVNVGVTMQVGSASLEAEFNWNTGNSCRLTVKHNYGTGVVYTAGPGYTVVGNEVNGIPASGVLTVETVDGVLSAYVDGDLVVTADYSAHTYEGSPNPVIGAFVRADAKNDGAIFGLTWEEYSA